jgi:hypothetical protein
MGVSFVQWTTTAAIALGFAFAGPSNASAKSVMRQCGDQWQAAKQAGTTNRETSPQFLKECRARLSSAASAPPSGGFAPAAPVPAPAPTPDPQTGSLFPWQQPAAPAPAPAPAQTNYGNAAPTAAGQFASKQEARYRCPSDTVVSVNERSHIYHFPEPAITRIRRAVHSCARRTQRPQKIARR